jgi:hypothetical protein
MARERSAASRWWLAVLVLVTLAAALDAQGRRGRNRGRGAGGAGGQGFVDPLDDRTMRDKQTWNDLNDLKVPNGKQAPLPPIYLPGFDSPKGSKEPAPVGPKPSSKTSSKAKTPAKPGAEKPIDPMQEADQVTAAADHRTEVEAAQAKLLGEHFQLCDLDASGWLSLRETEVTLSLDRGDFRRMDVNKDGRLDRAEFSAQGEQLLARLGARPVNPPLKKPATEPPS